MKRVAFSVSAFTPVADYFLDDHSFADHFEGDYSVPDYSVPDYSVPDYSVVITPWKSGPSGPR
jgi:hypothetical protein